MLGSEVKIWRSGGQVFSITYYLRFDSVDQYKHNNAVEGGK